MLVDKLQLLRIVKKCSYLLQLLQPRTSPAWPLEPSPMSRDSGSLPRLRDTAAAFPVADSTIKEVAQVSHTYTHRGH